MLQRVKCWCFCFKEIIIMMVAELNLATFLLLLSILSSELFFPTWLQVQQTVHRGQRQEESVQILQTEEVLQSWHEERRYNK